MRRILRPALTGLVMAALNPRERSRRRRGVSRVHNSQRMEMVVPEGYRRWSCVVRAGDELPQRANDDMKMFTIVFCESELVRLFHDAWHWPDKRFLVLELYGSPAGFDQQAWQLQTGFMGWTG